MLVLGAGPAGLYAALRMAEEELDAGQAGPMPHLACFFKEPMGVSEQSFADQVRLPTDYVARHTHQGRRGRNDRRAVRTPRAR